jgi:hypothetical protein
MECMIEGHEAPDEAAKKAATRQGRGCHETVLLAAAARRAVRQHIQQIWAVPWGAEKDAQRTRRLCKTPSRTQIGLYKGLSKPHAAIAIQLRTQRIALTEFSKILRRPTQTGVTVGKDLG